MLHKKTILVKKRHFYVKKLVFYEIYFCKDVLLQIYVNIKKNIFLTVPFFYATYFYTHIYLSGFMKTWLQRVSKGPTSKCVIDTKTLTLPTQDNG